MNNTALRFSTISTTATLHASTCQVVSKGPGQYRGHVIITEDVDAEVADIKERGYRVKRCACLK